MVLHFIQRMLKITGECSHFFKKSKRHMIKSPYAERHQKDLREGACVLQEQ